jgi:hypothetical protein
MAEQIVEIGAEFSLKSLAEKLENLDGNYRLKLTNKGKVVTVLYFIDGEFLTFPNIQQLF